MRRESAVRSRFLPIVSSRLTTTLVRVPTAPARAGGTPGLRPRADPPGTAAQTHRGHHSRGERPGRPPRGRGLSRRRTADVRCGHPPPAQRRRAVHQPPRAVPRLRHPPRRASCPLPQVSEFFGHQLEEFIVGAVEAHQATPRSGPTGAAHRQRTSSRSAEAPQSTTETTATGPADRFTGTVFVDGIRNPDEQSAVGCARARFAPGARTAWHHHPESRTLHVTDEVGLVVRRASSDAVVAGRTSSGATGAAGVSRQRRRCGAPRRWPPAPRRRAPAPRSPRR